MSLNLTSRTRSVLLYVTLAVACLLAAASIFTGCRRTPHVATTPQPALFTLHAQLQPGNLLGLKIADSRGALGTIERIYMLRWPSMDVLFCLDPRQIGGNDFQLVLPSTPAGTYRIYASVARPSGAQETPLSSVTMPYIAGRALTGDDIEATAIALKAGGLATQTSNPYKLPDGYTIYWNRPSQLDAGTTYNFGFTLLGPGGNPPQDNTPYLGAAARALIIKTDGAFFARLAAIDRPSFAYALPTPGTYRIFVQMQHGATVETGVFDAEIAPAQKSSPQS
jgi:hypothetical protein